MYMALLNYLKSAEGCLLDPKGTLAASVPLCAIAQADLEVQQLLSDGKARSLKEVSSVV